MHTYLYTEYYMRAHNVTKKVSWFIESNTTTITNQHNSYSKRIHLYAIVVNMRVFCIKIKCTTYKHLPTLCHLMWPLIEWRKTPTKRTQFNVVVQQHLPLDWVERIITNERNETNKEKSDKWQKSWTNTHKHRSRQQIKWHWMYAYVKYVHYMLLYCVHWTIVPTKLYEQLELEVRHSENDKQYATKDTVQYLKFIFPWEFTENIIIFVWMSPKKKLEEKKFNANIPFRMR